MKTFLKIFAAIFSLLILTAIAIPFLISADTLKGQLVAQVKKATGRTLEIKGDTKLTIFPNIAVEASDVTLSNGAGFKAPYLVHFDKLATGAALKPLLKKELIITGITVEGATLNLEQNASGAKNWEFTAEKLQDTAEDVAKAPEAQEESKSPLKRFALGDVTIKDTAVNYNAVGKQPMALSYIDVTLRGADANSPLELDGSAEYNGETISVALDVKDTKDFLAGKDSPIVLALKLPGGSLDFNGSGAMLENDWRAKGALDADFSALSRVMKLATGKAGGGMPEKVSAKGNLSATRSKIGVSDAKFNVDGTAATGSLAVGLGGAVPNITGNLALGDLDTAVFNKSGTSEEAGESNSAPRGSREGWSNEPINLDGLKAINADLDLTARSIKSGKLELGATDANVKVAGGKATVNLRKTSLYDGTASGVVSASTAGVAADVNIASVHIEPLLAALMDKSRLRGDANLKLNVRASGNSQQEWVNSMNGNGTFKVLNGAFKGIDVGKFLRDAKKGFMSDSESESTDFTELGGSFSMKDGVVSNSDLAMKSPALRLSGNGSASLPARTVNYRAVPTIAQTSKGQGGKDEVGGLTIPLMITGPWSNISITPDLAGMVQEGLKDPAAFKQNIQGLRDTIGDFNSKDDLKRLLTGEKAPAAETEAPAETTAPAQAAPSEAAPAAPLSEKEQRQQMIEQGIGNLLKGL